MSYEGKIIKAIVDLAERNGSSLAAIKKKLDVDPSKYRFINAALRTGVEKGVFLKNKGSYKVAAKEKKAATAKKKKATSAKAAVKKKTAAKKTTTKKKPAAKKTTTKKKPAAKKKTTKKKK